MYTSQPSNVKILIKLFIFQIMFVQCTVDMNMSEFQYLADHLHAEECRKLLAALHFESFDTPNALDQSEKKISKDITCLEQLLHWNSEKGGGKQETHELVSRRLNQIGRGDLAKWISKKSYEALGHDLERLTRDAFKLYEPIHLPKLNLTKTVIPGNKLTEYKPPAVTTVRSAAAGFRRIIKQESLPPVPVDPVTDPTEWTIFDTISWTIVLLLFLIIIVLMVYLTMAAPCCRQQKKKKGKRQQHLEYEESFYHTSSPSAMAYPTNNRYSPRRKECTCMQTEISQTPTSRESKTCKPFSKEKSCLTTPGLGKSNRNKSTVIEDDDFNDNRVYRQCSVQTIPEEINSNKVCPCPSGPYNLSPARPRNHHPSSKSLHLAGSSAGSEVNAKNSNRAAMELMGLDMPRGHSKHIRHHQPHVASTVTQAFRTIDIHQKIAIPMTSTAGT